MTNLYIFSPVGISPKKMCLFSFPPRKQKIFVDTHVERHFSENENEDHSHSFRDFLSRRDSLSHFHSVFIFFIKVINKLKNLSTIVSVDERFSSRQFQSIFWFSAWGRKIIPLKSFHSQFFFYILASKRQKSASKNYREEN